MMSPAKSDDRVHTNARDNQDPVVLLIDDHPIFRDGLVSLMHRILPDARLLESGSVPEASRILASGAPVDLMLLDLVFGEGPSGLEALEVMRRAHPRVPIVVLSGHDTPDLVLQTIELGAMGFIPKSATPDVLTHALGLVLAGEPFFPFSALRHAIPAMPEHGAGGTDADPWQLTAREREILGALARGMPNKLIAAELSIASEDTVRKHVSSVLRKMSVRNRTQAVLKLAASGVRLASG